MVTSEAMNNPAAELRGIKDVIPACPESFFALLYYRVERLTPERFPTSGNEKRNKRFMPLPEFQ